MRKSYQVFQSVGYGAADCTDTRTRIRIRIFQQVRTRYQGILLRAYRSHQNVGYDGYESRTKLTQVSGTVRLVVVSVPIPGDFNEAVSRTRVFYRRRTELPEVSGTDIGVVHKLTKVSGMDMEVVRKFTKCRIQ